jgi:hypothetical protein
MYVLPTSLMPGYGDPILIAFSTDGIFRDQGVVQAVVPEYLMRYFEAREIVLLEDHASRPQFRDIGLHVVHLPEGLGLAFDVPAPADGYRKIHERLPHS